METIELPLGGKHGEGKAAIIDATDAHLSEFRWYLEAAGYVRHDERADSGAKRCLRLHRVVLAAPKGFDVDHINRDKLDNRRANLRLVERGEQSQNTTPRVGYTSKYRGVYWNKQKQKWTAHGSIPGGVWRGAIGQFRYEQDAAEAARAWRLEHYPKAID